MELPIRAIEKDEIDAYHRAMGIGFFFDPPSEAAESFAATCEPDRARCVFDGQDMVATSGAYSLQLSVPGGRLPTGGTTHITVRPTHRRRGLLRRMMRAHIDDVRERGEALAALWASESAIYRRFGFGPATALIGFEIDPNYGAFSLPVEARGSLRMVDAPAAAKLLPDIYERVALPRPGHFERSEAWWRTRRLLDAPWQREGATALRTVVYEEGDEALGYATYRVKNRYDDHGHSRAPLIVDELQASDPHARAALWRSLLDVDLIETLHSWNQPVDDALVWLLADPRRLRTRWRDGLWVKLVDVARALEGRAYSAEGKLVLHVRDEFDPENEGSYTLEASRDGARCKRSSDAPDVVLRSEDLGALYLGGHRFRTLANAGRIEGDRDALRLADALFAWDVDPWCPEIF